MDTYKTRIANVQEGMRERSVDCFVITPSSTLTYLTGFSLDEAEERLLALVLTNSAEPFWVANRLYTQELSRTAIADRVFWQDGEQPFPMLAAALAERGCDTQTLMVDQMMPSRFLLPLIELYPGARLLPEGELVGKLRIRKDELELEQMRTACALADKALAAAIAEGWAWVGQTERDFFARLSLEMTRLGIKLPGAVVCTGANAAMPHHRADGTVIEAGSCLLVDFGGTYNGYYTDMTRNFYFGEPPEEYKTIYAVVLEALYAGQEAARGGGPMRRVDEAARGVITRHGYGEFFTHRTGHGIGIDVHEEPYAGPNSDTVMRPGMCFSIEPGIYLPGRFGVRIEDQVTVKDGGIEIFHSYPRELQIIGR